MAKETSSANRTRWPAVLLCLLFLTLTGIMLRKLWVQMARLDGDLSVYYNSANEFTSGMSPYYAGTRYIYPPLFAWLVAPLASLTPVQYAVAWGLVLGACWVASVLLVLRLTVERGWMVVLLPNLILFRCIWNGWGHGQLSLLMSAMVLAFLVLERERRMIGAAFWLAFAGALKVFPFYLGVLFLTKRNAIWIAVLGAWTLVLSGLPAITVGPRALWSMVFDGFFGPAMGRIHAEHALVVNHAPVPHLYQVLGIISHPSLKLALVLCMVVVTALVLISRRPIESRERDNLWLSFVLASCLMVCPHVWMHYFTLLLLPFTAALVYVRKHPGTFAARVLTAGLVVSGLAFNSGSTLFVSDKISTLIDRVGVLSIGLVAIWLALAVVVLRRAPVTETIAQPDPGIDGDGVPRAPGKPQMDDVSLA